MTNVLSTVAESSGLLRVPCNKTSPRFMEFVHDGRMISDSLLAVYKRLINFMSGSQASKYFHKTSLLS